MSAERGKTKWPALLVAIWFGSALVLFLLVWAWFLTRSEQWYIAGVAVLGTACLAFLAWAARALLRRDRQTALVRLAKRRGFLLDPQRRSWKEAWHADFDLFTRQEPLERWNVLTGTWRQVVVEAFDYSYRPQRSDDDTPSSARRTAAVVVLAQDVPSIIIEPNRTNLPRREGSIITWYGGVDGEAELSDFHRRYVVMAEDLEVSARLLHPEMETFLLRSWNTSVQIVGRRAIFFAERLLQPHELIQLLDFAAGFCELIPESLTATRGDSGGATS